MTRLQVAAYVVDTSSGLTIAHLDGVRWTDAPIPPRRHTCWAQTRGVGTHGLAVARCACGAISFERGRWEERNVRRADDRALARARRKRWVRRMLATS